MSTSPKRMELQIEVSTLGPQRALVRADLTPPELVAAVLAEFREIDELGDQVAQYRLVHQGSGEPLDEQRTLEAQLAAGAQLVIAEHLPPLPAGATRPAHALYLRERASGRVSQLAWLPALIGRADPGRSGSEPVCLDLSEHSAGQRVSRRHAQIIERGGQYLIERLSSNPTALIDSAGRTIMLADDPLPIQPDDTILLERSQIALRFLVRDDPRAKE